MEIYLLLWIIIQYSFICCLNWSSFATGSSFSGLLYLFGLLLSLCFLPHIFFLTLLNALGSSCILCMFPICVLVSAISPRLPGSFYWRLVLGIRIWVLGTLVATVTSLLLGVSADRERKKYV